MFEFNNLSTLVYIFSFTWIFIPFFPLLLAYALFSFENKCNQVAKEAKKIEREEI